MGEATDGVPEGNKPESLINRRPGLGVIRRGTAVDEHGPDHGS